MLSVMNMAETIEYLKKNLYEYDLYVLPIDAAVRLGSIIPVPVSKGEAEHFVPAESTDSTGMVWKVEYIRRLTDDEMKAENLHCRYRYKVSAVNAPENHEGASSINAGFNI